MSKKKTGSATVRLTELKNNIRGSLNPYSALSKVRAIIPKDQLSDFITWLPAVRHNGHSLFPGHFPKVASDLYKIWPPAAVSLEREIAWTGGILRLHSKKLTSFVQIAADYSRTLASGQLDECKDTLDTLDRIFGLSFWTIETRIALLQLLEGLEAQKAFARGVVKQRPSNDIVAFFTHTLSRRNEPTSTPIRFVRQAEEQLTLWGAPADIRAYLLFRISNKIPATNEGFAAILRHETSAAIIDQYSTFIRLAQEVSVSGDQLTKDFFAGELNSLAKTVDDERIRRTLFLLTAQPDWLASSTIGSFTADDLVAESNHKLSNKAAIEEAAKHPLDVDSWVTLAEASIETAAPLSSSNTIRDVAIANMVDLIRGSEETVNSINSLLHIALNNRLQPFSLGIDDFVHREASSDPRRGTAKSTIAFLQSTFIRPSSITRLPAQEQREALASILKKSRSNSASLHQCLLAVELDAGEGNLAEELSQEARLEAKISAALQAKHFSTALSLAQELTSTDDLVRKRYAARCIAFCLLELNNLEELVDFIASKLVVDRSLVYCLPLSQCAEALDKNLRRKISGKISVAIVLDFYSKYISDQLDNIRDYAYEDFLLAHNLERASQLTAMVDQLNLEQLVYYLRFVCVPEVMQISSVFQGTRELEDERKIVLSLLVQLDAEMAKEYETEIREVTRTQLIHRGIRQVEKSKIYVDVSTIKKLFEKKHKETFQRYQSLRKAGLGVLDGGLVEALQGALTGMPIPQHFLDVPKDEASDLLRTMLGSLFEECTVNPEHGIDCYLSMRIRHGTLSGQLRTPLEVQKIITQRAAGTDQYESNKHWLSRLSHLEPSMLDEIDTCLAQFSADYDALIGDIANELIQVKSTDKPKGLFSISVNSIRFRLWATDISDETTFESFLDGCMDLFWESVESSLQNVRRVIDDELKALLTDLFAKLESKISLLTGDIPTADLDRAIRTGLTSAHQSLDLVKDWFRLSQPLSEPYFPIEDLIDVGMRCVCTIHRDFSPIVEKRAPPLPKFANALVLFSDIFFIIFDNIRRHSGVGSHPKVTIDIQDLGDKLVIVTKNETSTLCRSQATSDRMDRIREVIACGNYGSSVSSEGGTGLIKLKKLISGVDRRPMQLDFGFAESGSEFYVHLEIAKKEIDL